MGVPADMTTETIYVIAGAFFTAMFGFFGVVLREMRQNRIILEQIATLQKAFNEHLQEHTEERENDAYRQIRQRRRRQ